MARGSGAGSRLPARNRALPSPKSPASPPLHSDLLPAWKPTRRCRRVRRPAFPGPAGRRSGPATPLLRWNFEDAAKPLPSGGEENAAGVSSARKLAAAIWQLRPPEVTTAAGGVRGNDSTCRALVGMEPAHRNLHIQLLKPSSAMCHHSLKNEISSPISVLDPNNCDFLKLDASATLPFSAMDKASKWDPGSSPQASDNAFQLASKLGFVEDLQGTNDVYTLQLELQQARARIRELEVEQLSAKKKLDHFLKKLVDEKAAWRIREHNKIQTVIEGLKTNLDKEKRNRRRLDIINSKLVDEAREAKLSVKQLMQDYEKERKAREFTEEVCNELAKEVEEDKAEIEALKQELVKIREEVDEERKMLQMAEVWREERVQMKLIDAKLTLESKYSQLSNLQLDIENFLGSQKGAKIDIAVVREAEHLVQAVDSLKIEAIKQFAYEPPPESEDILSIFKELRPREEAEAKEIEMCDADGPLVHESEIHAAKPGTIFFLEKPAKLCANGSIYDESDVEDGSSSWEMISRDEKGSSNSPEGSEPSVNKICGNYWEESGSNSKRKEELLQDRSGGMKLVKKKESALSRLWKPSRAKNWEGCKKDTVEICNGRLSNATYSPEVGQHEIGLSPQGMAGQCSSPDSLNVNLHFSSRGFRGCIECPRGMLKHSLKAKLLEARMESHNIQLRHVLKQKI